MTKEKFTKGHWKRCYHANGCQYVSANTGLNGCYSVASLHGPDDVANAHLIASSPEMYGVISAMLEQFDTEEICQDEYDYVVIREAKKVLAKARGEYE